MSERLGSALGEVDAAFARFHEARWAPGVAWGVVSDGKLVHAGGLGTLCDGEDHLPDADSVFGIASMTKSFTAAMLLLLRDEGLLRLDDPVAAHVPELADWRPPTADSPAVTIRHLLTMSAGLATDDAWGDRQQGLPLDRFAELLRAGPSFAWPPGTAFEYSNLGYGILGRVITNVAGREYREVVAERLLAPLGLDATTYHAADVPDARLARGHVRRDEAFQLEPLDGYGALAAMGGILSSVRDLARWVAFFTDAYPARDDPEGRYPLVRASRREMQQVQRAIPPRITAPSADAEPATSGGGYGYGLFVALRPGIGTTVGHPGGYPGFGSNMRWHPATGLGVVGLANGRYARVQPVVVDALDILVRAEVAPRRSVAPAPATRALRATVGRLLDRWDDALADSAFAMNMDLDEPRERRRTEIERIREVHGVLRDDETTAPISNSPADLEWWLRGERGRVRVSIQATPEPEPRLQRLDLVSVPEPPEALLTLAEQVVGIANDTSPSWPDDLQLAGPDRATLERGLRAAGTRFGPVALGEPTAGDGRTTATFALACERGRAELRVGLDPETGAVTIGSIVPSDIEAPPEAW